MKNASLRGLLIAIGASAIVWAMGVLEVYRFEAAVVDVGRRALSGEKFSHAQLGTAGRTMDEVASSIRAHSSGLNSLAVVRLLLAEDELRARKRAAADLADVQLAVGNALAISPMNSFAWLVSAWIKRQRGEAVPEAVSALRMSYQTGPNEAWIAAMRNPLVLGIFLALPGELAEKALAEFGGLVRARLYAAAADILAGPGWVVREQLLGGLVDLDDENRRQFARALAAKDIDVKVHGVKDPPFRRF